MGASLMRRLIFMFAAVLAVSAGYIDRDFTNGRIVGTPDNDWIFAGAGSAIVIGCGGDDMISGGNDQGAPQQDLLYGDGRFDQCPDSYGDDNLHGSSGDIAIGGLCAADGTPNQCDIYRIHGMRFPKTVIVDGEVRPGWFQVDRFNVGRDHFRFPRPDTVFIVDARNFPFVPNTVLPDGRIREHVTGLELRTTDFGPHEGSEVWAMLKFDTPVWIVYAPGRRYAALETLLKEVLL